MKRTSNPRRKGKIRKGMWPMERKRQEGARGEVEMVGGREVY
uniref:Uncharacterized protein n=1 Tax=Anguilla anguilla TaxID=7936 RepID=A0A0E9U742_ANGAN